MRRYAGLGVGAFLPVLALFIALAAWFWSAPPGGQLRVLDPAPDFRLADPAGHVVSLSDFKGRVLLLDFWATWCRTCEEEAPVLSRLYRRYRDQGLAILAPSVDKGGRRALLAYGAGHDIPYQVVLADARTAEAYGVTGLPVHVLIDAQGRVAKRILGPVDPAALENDILRLLPEPNRR